MSTFLLTLTATLGIIAGMAVTGLALVLLAALAFDTLVGRCTLGWNEGTEAALVAAPLKSHRRSQEFRIPTRSTLHPHSAA